MPTVNLDVFDVVPGARPAVVTPLGGVGITSTVQWFQDVSGPSEQGMSGGSVSAVNRRQVVYVRRDHVPTLPVGSTIVGGPEPHQKTWRVVTVDTGDEDYFIAAVV